MKIFVLLSRKDAGDFAESVQKVFTNFKYDIFTDTDSISVGDIWDRTIATNISSCDIFVVIITYGALQSPHIENEVLQAQNEKKKKINYLNVFHRTLRDSHIKWVPKYILGVEFIINLNWLGTFIQRLFKIKVLSRLMTIAIRQI